MAVVAYKLDRICRSFTDFARFVEMCDEHDFVIVSVTQKYFTTRDLGPKPIQDALRVEIERKDRVRRALYPRSELLRTRYDKCQARALSAEEGNLPQPVPRADESCLGGR